MEVKDFKYKGHRNSYTELNEAYFWTITINQWRPLLKSDENKMAIIKSLQWLCGNQLIQLYGYVIMPNHIHLLWNQLKMNGKEFPKNSFEKFTAKFFVKKMQQQNDMELQKYFVTAVDRQYNIWQRDPLAIRVFSREMAEQKLEYIHYNPLQEHWALCASPEDYRFSSAAFYANGIDEFNIITHYMDVF
jgi:putative transposase